MAVNAGQHIEGVLRMEANEMQSYFVRLRMQIKALGSSTTHRHAALLASFSLRALRMDRCSSGCMAIALA